MSDKKHTRISAVMSASIISIEPTATVHDATELMREHRTSSIVVERRDIDDEYGLVEVADIARKVVALNLSPARVNVYEIMTKPVITLPAEMSTVHAADMLSRFNLTRALVIGHERNLLGIVTLRDMVLRNVADIEEA